MTKIILIFISLAIVNGCKRKEQMNVKLVSELIDSLAEKDQRIIALLDSSQDVEKPKLEEIQKEIFKDNGAIVKKIFEEFGYPGADRIGESSSHNFWLLVQHADHDVEFQRQVLEQMEIEIKNKNAMLGDFAYLTDRVNINSGEPQIYGTQIFYNQNGEPEPKPILHPDRVDSLRSSVGLEPLRYYLSFMKALRAKPGEEIDIVVNMPK